MTTIRARAREQWRWFSRPWRSPAVLGALVAAFAAPVMMVGSADLFAVAGGDAITERVVDEAGARRDVLFAVDGELGIDSVDEIEEAMRTRIADIDGLGEPTMTLFTESVGTGAVPSGPGAPLTVTPGSGGRFFVRDGAIDALDVVDEVDEDGIWISERYASRFELEPGMRVGIEGSSVAVVIAGVHRDLWEVDRNTYWDRAPTVLVPRFSRIFGAPLFELFIASPDVVDALGLAGTARFDVVVDEPPTTRRDLTRLTSELRAIERDFTRAGPLSTALDRFSGVGSSVPALSTELFALASETAERSAALEQPIATTSIGGVVLGLLISVAGGGFVARRRSREMRLLRSDGDAWWRFVLRALGEYVAPGAVGTMVGVLLGWAVIRFAGPTRSAALSDIDVSTAVACGAAGVLGAALATATIATRSLERATSSGHAALLRWLLPIAAVAGVAWVQVGGEERSDSVDLLVVLFPILGLVAGSGLVVVALRWLLVGRRQAGADAPTALFLAWRRIAAAQVGAVGLAIVVGSSVGLVVFPTLVVESLKQASLAKAVAVVGGPTSVQLTSRVDRIPERSTIVLTESTRLSVGSQVVSVQAIDPATYADVVSWDPQFGSSPGELLDVLDAAAVRSDVIPAVLVGSSSMPTDGAFGTDAVYDYRIVGALAGAPLVSISPTIIVRADRFDEVALEGHLAGRSPGVSEAAWIEQFDPPTSGYRRELVTDLPLAELTATLDADEVGYRAERTLNDELDTLDNQAVRWSFSYFRVLAAISAVAAAAGLLLYLDEQRGAKRELADALTRRMGLGAGGRLRASLVEVCGLVSVALAVGTGVAIVLAARVFGRFEPAPGAIPDTGLRVAWPTVALVVVVGELVTVALVMGVHRRGQRRPLGEILRGQ